MERLPLELLQSICSHCDASTLKACRFANRHFRDAVTPRLFEELHIGLFEEDMQRLLSISGSKIADLVKTLVFISDKLIPDLDRAHWEAIVDIVGLEPTCFGSADGSTTIARYNFLLNTAWDSFRLRRAEQQSWRHDLKILLYKEAFLSLTHLRNVEVVSPNDCYLYLLISRATGEPRWRRTRNSTVLGPDDVSYSLEFRVERRQRRPDPLYGLAAFYILGAMAYRASFAGMRQVQSLTLDIGCYNLLSDSLFLREGPRSLTSFTGWDHQLIEAFGNLTQVHLEQDIPTSEKTVEKTIRSLRAAHKLRKLHLHHSVGEEQPPFSLESLFEEEEVVLWPFLEEISLGTSVATRRLVAFLKAHAESLRRVRLWEMYSSDWQPVLHQLATMLKLDVVELRSLRNVLDEPEEGGITEYLHMFIKGTCFHGAAFRQVMCQFERANRDWSKIDPDLSREDDFWGWQNILR